MQANEAPETAGVGEPNGWADLDKEGRVLCSPVLIGNFLFFWNEKQNVLWGGLTTFKMKSSDGSGGFWVVQVSEPTEDSWDANNTED